MTKVYKKSVGINKYIQVGTINNYGFIEFLEPSPLLKNYEPVGNRKPQIFYPEFYVDFETNRVMMREIPKVNDQGEQVGTRHIPAGTFISSIDKKVFIPKNISTQLVSLVGSTFLEPKQYYVTGYVTNDGIAVYYDQYRS